jgi:hypothetical protein
MHCETYVEVCTVSVHCETYIEACTSAMHCDVVYNGLRSCNEL